MAKLLLEEREKNLAPVSDGTDDPAYFEKAVTVVQLESLIAAAALQQVAGPSLFPASTVVHADPDSALVGGLANPVYTLGKREAFHP